MRTRAASNRLLVVVLSGALAGCAGGTMPVSHFHEGSPAVGTTLAQQKMESGGAAVPAAPAGLSSGRAGPVAASVGGGAPAGGAHAAKSGHGGGGSSGGGK